MLFIEQRSTFSKERRILVKIFKVSQLQQVLLSTHRTSTEASLGLLRYPELQH